MTKKIQVKADVIAKISLNFPKDLWMDLKRRALEDEETVTDILVRLAAMYVRSGKKRRSALS